MTEAPVQIHTCMVGNLMVLAFYLAGCGRQMLSMTAERTETSAAPVFS